MGRWDQGLGELRGGEVVGPAAEEGDREGETENEGGQGMLRGFLRGSVRAEKKECKNRRDLLREN